MDWLRNACTLCGIEENKLASTMPDSQDNTALPSPPSFALWRLTTLRHARLAWKQTLTLILILSLGVATYLSIRMAARAAATGFSDFTETLTGQTDATVTAPAGAMQESQLRALRRALGNEPAHIVPVLESTAAFPNLQEYGGPVIQLLGLDLIGIRNLQSNTEWDFGPGGEQTEESAFWGALRGNQSVFISEELATEFDLEKGATVTLLVNDRLKTVSVQGILPPQKSNPLGRLMVMDLPTLQTLTERTGQIDRVEIIVPQGTTYKERSERVREKLLSGAEAGGWVVREPMTRREQGERLTQAFRLNLQILALIALLTGLYLIAQAMDAAVVRRRQEIAILRSLGVTPKAIQKLWLVESLILGLVGSVAGIALGAAMAQVTVKAVSTTINALYRATAVESVTLTTADVMIGFGLGILGSLIAGIIPAKDAAATLPAQSLAAGNQNFGSRFLHHPRLGLALLVTGTACLLAGPVELEGGARFPLFGYAAAFLWLLGGSLLLGTLFPLIGKATGVLRHRSATSLYAGSRLARAGSRHRLAAAGMLVAISMAGAMSLLVGSFEKTMVDWINVRFQADIYLSSAGMQSASSQNYISPKTWKEIASRPEIEAADPFHVVPISIKGMDTFLAGSDLSLLGNRQKVLWLEQPLDESVTPQETDTVGYINESFSYRFGVSPGETIAIPTPGGPRSVFIRGMQADYGNERGLIWVNRAQLSEWFATDFITNLTLFVKPEYVAEDVVNQLKASYPELQIRGNQALREIALGIFRQTFALTHALKLIALAVALAGLALGLISILRESLPEMQTLRRMGFTQRELAKATALEGLGISLAGLLSGLALSAALGWLLIYVINRQSFGWTLQIAMPWADLLLLSISIIAAGCGLSWAIGRWGANLRVENTEE